MALHKIKERDGLVKDSETGAILNVNSKAVDEYAALKAKMAAARRSNEELNTAMQKIAEIDDMKRDIAEIKELLKGLVK